MRIVKGRGLGLIVLSAVIPLLSQPPAFAGEQTALSHEASSTADYYTRRAKRILEMEKAKAAKPHPLAAAYPGQDIVVCEAGCADRRGAHVVYMRRQAAVTEQREAMMVPSSSAPPYAPASAGVGCIAGCYGGAANVAAERDPAPTSYPAGRMQLPPRDRFSPIR
jgi:hypothetical protein